MEALAERIREAAAQRRPLRLRGGGTKDFYGNEPRGDLLDTRSYAGIVSYEPTELVVTARCGTPLAEVETTLHENRQMLAFEPPHFGAGATFGGCIAAGLSGPRRAAAGALRDFVLGVKLVDGRGRVLSFGGQVMKNVAGYDVSRLMAGALGTLGVITEVSFKVLPLPDLSMDRIVVVHGLEYSENLRGFLREMWRVLSDGGRLLVVVPNRRSIWARADHTPFGHGHPCCGSVIEILDVAAQCQRLLKAGARRSLADLEEGARAQGARTGHQRLRGGAADGPHQPAPRAQRRHRLPHDRARVRVRIEHPGHGGRPVRRRRERHGSRPGGPCPGRALRPLSIHPRSWCAPGL